MLAVVLQVRDGPSPVAAVAARARARLGRLGAAGRNAGAGRTLGGLESPPSGRKGRRSRGRASGAAWLVERAHPQPAGVASWRRRSSGSCPPASNRNCPRTPLAPRRRSTAARVRPQRDRPRRPGPSARKALVHQRRLRPRAVLPSRSRGAPRSLRRGARPRGVGDQPQTRAAAAQRAGRTTGAPARAGTRGRTPQPRSIASANARSRSRIRSPRSGRLDRHPRFG